MSSCDYCPTCGQYYKSEFDEENDILAKDDRYSATLLPENHQLRVQWLKEMGMMPDDEKEEEIER